MSRKKATPVVFQGLQAGLRMFRWIVLVLVGLFFLSGIQKVDQSGVGLLLRFGKLTGGQGSEVRQPGAVFALPYPIDQLIQVPVKQEEEVEVDEVWKAVTDVGASDKIDPVLEGYCLTGDQNIIQTKVVAKYRITDPVQYRLHVAEPEEIVREAVLASLTQTIAGWDVDDVLRQQRGGDAGPGTTESLREVVTRRAQQRLDAIHTGIALAPVEFKELHPPRHVSNEFRDVTDARTEMETAKRQAEGYVSSLKPQAEATANQLVQAAQARKSTLVGQAQSEYAEFEPLYREYQKNPVVVRKRMFLETLESLAGVGKLRFLAPGSNVILNAPETGEKK